jgi:hypothetical protein
MKRVKISSDKSLFIVLGLLSVMLVLFLIKSKNDRKEKYVEISDKCTSCSA